MDTMDKNYSSFYQKISAPLRAHPAGLKAVIIVNRLLTGLMYAVYPLLLILLAVRKEKHFLPVLLVPAVSFVVLSFFRKRINRPRPYTTWPIDPLIHKKTAGKSMPSRHVFSSVVISMAVLSIAPVPGIILLILSALMGLVRIIGGVHYPSDVLVGYACGIAAGLILLLCTIP